MLIWARLKGWIGVITMLLRAWGSIFCSEAPADFLKFFCVAGGVPKQFITYARSLVTNAIQFYS
jgi:hypothetical protein